jgi:hypothetical protein
MKHASELLNSKPVYSKALSTYNFVSNKEVTTMTLVGSCKSSYSIDRYLYPLCPQAMLTTPPASPSSAAALLPLLAVVLVEVVQLSWVPSSALHSVRAPLCPIAMASPSPENVIQVTRLCSDVVSDVASRKQCRWSISTPPRGAMLCVAACITCVHQ